MPLVDCCTAVFKVMLPLFSMVPLLMSWLPPVDAMFIAEPDSFSISPVFVKPAPKEMSVAPANVPEPCDMIEPLFASLPWVETLIVPSLAINTPLLATLPAPEMAMIPPGVLPPPSASTWPELVNLLPCATEMSTVVEPIPANPLTVPELMKLDVEEPLPIFKSSSPYSETIEPADLTRPTVSIDTGTPSPTVIIVVEEPSRVFWRIKSSS